MKVVHLSTTDYGGAYKATQRISQCMSLGNVDSKVIVRTKVNRESSDFIAFSNPLSILLSKIKNLVNLLLSRGEIISDYLGTNITKNKHVKNADIIFLHWVNSFISYKNVEQLINLGKPIIWVIHDMWLFTGGCHCDKYCGGYIEKCTNCFMISKNSGSNLSNKNFMRKQKMMSSGKIYIIGPSKWIVNCAKASPILANCKVECIPNPIDTSIFKILQDKQALRIKYNIPINKKVILFGAVNATRDTNKGSQYIQEIANNISNQNVLLVVFGNKKKEVLSNLNMETKYLGFISDEEKLVEIYNIADVFVAPSTQESFGYTVAESLACGTPVVAFGVGGILDQIKHRKNGYIAKLGDAEDLLQGILFCLSHSQNLKFESNRASFKEQGELYRKCCERLLNNDDKQ